MRLLKKTISSWVFSIINFFFTNSEQQVIKAVRLGSDYGGWWIPENLPDTFSRDSVFISAGVGEDISFDLAIVEHYRLSGVLVDPTRKSFDYIKSTLGKYENLNRSKIMHRELDILKFVLSADEALTISFINKAVWKNNNGVVLIPPDNPKHVSYRLRGPGRGELFDTVSISDLFSEYKNVKLIKLDIEGSELAILSKIALENLKTVELLLIEFDFLRHPRISDFLTFCLIAVKLRFGDYFLMKREGLNFTFIKRKAR